MKKPDHFRRFSLEVSEPESQLLLTPFIDVIFLITIFFVLTSAFSFLSVIKIDLPSSETSQNLLPDPLVVSIDASDNLYVNQQKVTEESFLSVFQDLRSRNPEIESVVLNAYKHTPLQKVIVVMDKIRMTGITEISVHTSDGP